MITIATETELKNNFEKYLDLVMSGQEVIVTKSGQEVARFVPREASVSYLTDSLTGILRESDNYSDVRTERLLEKYGIVSYS